MGVGGGAPAIPVDTIRRDEVNAVLANQRELVSATRDIKNFVTDVHSKVTNIQAHQQRGQGSVEQVKKVTKCCGSGIICRIRQAMKSAENPLV